MTYLIKLWSMVVHDLMFGYKRVEILLENIAEILVVLLIYCWFNYWLHAAGFVKCFNCMLTYEY